MIRKTMLVLAVAMLVASLSPAQVATPADLKYEPLAYDPPDPLAFRTVFAGGMRGYLQEDHSLPLFNISALINFGDLDVARAKRGLGSVMSRTLIQGGTTTREGDAIEERIDFLGGVLSFSVGERTSTLTLSVLSKDLDEGLTLFFDVLRNPVFREGPLGLAKARLIQELRRADDQPSNVLRREYETLVYGDHPLTWRAIKSTYDGITEADLKAAHAQYFYPGNIILAAAGDFATAELRIAIDRHMAGWENRETSLPQISTTFAAPEPGVYFIQKEINQGYISLGHIGIEDTNPDYYAVQVMNFILGGGSFTSRITSKVRSDEGLSYNQGSRFTYRWGFPGTFSGYVQTKSATAGYAISLILNELAQIRETEVSDAEMATAINYYLESFPSAFESPQTTMSTFAELEMTGKPMDYYAKYRANFSAVTKQKVQEVARKHIKPEAIAIMIVGDWEPCNEGGDKWAGPLSKLGKVHTVTLPDPVTGEIPK